MKHIIAAAVLTMTAVTAAAQASEAEVIKVDKSAGKITLKHGEIKNLEMPAMTMVFRVKDAGWLDQFAKGDKVRFDAQKIDGQYVVTAIKRAP